MRKELKEVMVSSLLVAPPRRRIVDVCGYTIDPPSAQDLDDAINVYRDGVDYVCEVHVADVTSLVAAGDAADRVAMTRAEKKYLKNKNISMLPSEIERRCSLTPGESKFAVTLRWRMNEQGEMISSLEVFRSSFRSTRCWHYEEFDRALEKGEPDLLMLQKVSGWLNKLRNGDHSWFGTFYGDLWVDDEGCVFKQPHRSQAIVAEWMIFANYQVARFCARNEIPALYRNHAIAEGVCIEADAKAVMLLGDLKQIKRKIGHQLGKAQYGSSSKGHFALCLQSYLRFTSPLRRYSDLINHRQILSWVDRGEHLTAEQLEPIAVFLNQAKEKESQRRTDYFKNQTEKEHSVITQTGLSAVADGLSLISPSKFTGVIEAACNSRKLDLIQSEIARRLEQGKLTYRDMQLILFKGGDCLALKNKIMGNVSDSDAMMILHMAHQNSIVGLLEIDSEELLDRWSASIKTKFDGVVLTTPEVSTDKRKRAAKNAAAKAWLIAMINGNLIEPVALDGASPQLEEIKDLPTLANTASIDFEEVFSDAVSLLNRLAQSSEPKEAVLYQTKEDFHDGCPSFRTVATWRGLTGEGLGRSKKRAKALAAQNLWKQIRQEA
jgi:hypothetical protein